MKIVIITEKSLLGSAAPPHLNQKLHKYFQHVRMRLTQTRETPYLELICENGFTLLFSQLRCNYCKSNNDFFHVLF